MTTANKPAERVNATYSLGADTLELLDRVVSTHPLRPKKSAFVELAIREKIERDSRGVRR